MAKGSRSNRGKGYGRSGGRPARTTNRQYPRTARLNTLLQEIVADFFERIDDERFEMLTITGVEVDSDLNRAQVFVSALGTVPLLHHEGPPAEGGQDVSSKDDHEEPDDPTATLLAALADYRKPVQRKIGREARIRKTPEVAFVVDPGVRSGARIEQILASIRDDEVPPRPTEDSSIPANPTDGSAEGD